ncbi:hypothetical protein SEA_ZIGGYZOO_41 [Gordonia phage ZiggyZoo]|nr:hypothetical protein SEA_ZIGGYZOO_41 [Gordonia phage ZiggyZoo]
MAVYAEWHLIQYTPDMRRREPRNIGLAASDGESWQVRLLATHPRTGVVDWRALRSLHIAKEDYEQWVDYFRHMIMNGQIARIRRSQRHRPSEFRVIPGGRTEMHSPLTEFLDMMYGELVQPPKVTAAEGPARVLAGKVERVLRAAEIDPVPEPLVPAVWEGDTHDAVRFNYAFTNGQTHLMDRLQLSQPSLEQSKMLARDFNARAHAVEKAGYASSFIAFYSQEVVDQVGDSVLAPLWRVGKIVDVDQTGSAAERIRDLIYS